MHPYIAEQLVSARHAQALADAHHSRLVRAATANRPQGDRPRLGPRWRQRLGVGVLGLIAALATIAAGTAESGPHPSTSRPGVEPISVVGLRAISSQRVSYPPGASRTWSAGPTSVGVKVLLGRLSVYGPDGERRVYVAGEGFAAGWAEYRTVNETDEPVETLVTDHVRP